VTNERSRSRTQGPTVAFVLAWATGSGLGCAADNPTPDPVPLVSSCWPARAGEAPQVAGGGSCKLIEPVPCDALAGSCSRFTCAADRAAPCLGRQDVDADAAYIRLPSVDLVDVGADSFVVGYIDAARKGGRYAYYSVYEGEVTPPFAVDVDESTADAVATIRGATSPAVYHPDAFCASDRSDGRCVDLQGREGPCSAWGTYTNFFAIEVSGRVYVDIHRFCGDHRPSFFSRVFLGTSRFAGWRGDGKHSSGPSVAATPDGKVLVAWGAPAGFASSRLAVRALVTPPGRDGEAAELEDMRVLAPDALTNAPAKTSLVFDDHWKTFAIGMLWNTIGELRTAGTMLLPDDATQPMTFHDWMAPGDGQSGSHYGDLAYNPRSEDGAFVEWRLQNLGAARTCSRGVVLEDGGTGAPLPSVPVWCTIGGDAPLEDGYQYTVPLAATYAGTDVLYVLVSTDDPFTRGRLFGLTSDHRYVLLDALTAPGDAPGGGLTGSPYAVRSLRDATVIATTRPSNSADATYVQLTLSGWHNPPVPAP
jgi:hypothetical protein